MANSMANTMALEEHQVNLFGRYEHRLLSGGSAKPQIIPAVVITGFLGSGKTTLVQHILRNRGSLRIAVLVNEVGTVDVDSELVNAKQSNAALGLSATDLSGGCICCARSEDLAAALRRLRAPPVAGPTGAAGGGDGGAPCDYLLVETSGAADAGPLAEALVASGFRLDAVVAVVDAEAGPEALRHPVARAQVCCADVVVLNKCDLLAGGPGGGLAQLADLEDALEGMAPGVRLLRARFGEVPLTAVLDVEPVDASPDPAPTPTATSAAASAAAGAAGPGAAGGFMSHESVPALVRGGGGGGGGGGAYRLPSGPLTADGMAVGSSRHTKRRAPGPPPPPAPPPALGLGHHHHQHQQAAGSPGHRTAEAGGAAHAHAGDAHSHTHTHPHPHTHSEGHAPTHAGAHAGAHAESHAQSHAALHSGFHTESVVAAGAPGSLLAFASFVVRHLVVEPALLRSKGVLWFSERRSQRFTFHLSGRRRVECCQEGPWEGPPCTQLVFIGTDASAMRRLRHAFETEVLLAANGAAVAAAAAAAAAPPPPAGSGSPGPAAVVSRLSGDQPCTEPSLQADVAGGSYGAAQQAAAAAPAGPGGGTGGAVGAVAARIASNERLELLPGGCSPPAGALAAPFAAATSAPGAPDGAGLTTSPDPSSGGGVGLMHFTARGSVLHGIRAEELNAELARRCNATGRLMLVGVTAPGSVSAVTHLQSRDRVASLLFPTADVPEDAQAQARALLEVAEPLLRKAYAHVHNCKCDVAGAMALKG